MTLFSPSFGKSLLAASALSFACLVVARDAQATLGGDVPSVAANAQNLAGARQVQKLASGERHEITLASGIVVREYVSPGGAVYAVTWRGPRMPDLREILGTYFGQLSARAPRGGHNRLNVTTPDLVVRSIGHHGTFSGRAWLPSLIPAGVDIQKAID